MSDLNKKEFKTSFKKGISFSDKDEITEHKFTMPKKERERIQARDTNFKFQDLYDQDLEDEKKIELDIKIPKNFKFIKETYLEFIEQNDKNQINQIDFNQKFTVEISPIICQLKNLIQLSIARSNLNNVDDLLSDFCSLKFLKILNLSHNEISSIHLKPYKEFTNLNILYINQNRIKKVEDIESILEQSRLLNQIGLQGNEVFNKPNYRFEIIKKLPKICIVDQQQVSDDERQPTVQFNMNKFSSMNPAMYFHGRIKSEFVRQEKLNFDVLIGITKDLFEHVIKHVPTVDRNPDYKFTSLCDSFLIDQYKKEIENIRMNSEKKSPIYLIQRMLRLKIAEKNFTTIKKNVNIATGVIKKQFLGQATRIQLKENNQVFYNTIQRFNIIKDWFDDIRNLNTLKWVQRVYRRYFHKERIRLMKRHIIQRMQNLFIANRAKLNIQKKMYQVDKQPKIMFLKNQMQDFQHFMKPYKKMLLGKQVHQEKDQQALRVPVPDDFKQSEFMIANIQKYLHAPNFLVSKRKNLDISLTKDFSFLKVCQQNKTNLENLKRFKRFQKAPAVKLTSKKYKIADDRIHNIYRDDQFRFISWQPENDQELFLFLNWVQYYNKKSQHDMLKNTVKYYFENQLKQKDPSRAFAADDHISDIDATLLDSIKHVLSPNLKEIEQERTLEEEYPKIKDRILLGSAFNTFANMYPFKSYLQYSQFIFWPEQNIRLVAAAVSIQTCWRRQVTRRLDKNNVIMNMTSRRASNLIKRNIRSKIFRSRIKFINQLTESISLLNSNAVFCDPTKKKPDGCQDLVIDELSFYHLINMSEDTVLNNIKQPEQKIAFTKVESSISNVPFEWFVLPSWPGMIERSKHSFLPNWTKLKFLNIINIFTQKESLELDEFIDEIGGSEAQPQISKLKDLKSNNLFDRVQRNSEFKVDPSNELMDRRTNLMELIKADKNYNNNKNIEVDKKDDNVRIQFINEFYENGKGWIKTKLNKKQFKGFYKNSILNSKPINFKELLMGNKELEISRANRLFGSEHSDQLRFIRIPCGNQPDMLLIHILTFLFTYDNHENCINILPEAILNLTTYEGETFFNKQIVNHNLKFLHLKEYPKFNDFHNQKLINNTMNQDIYKLNPINLNDNIITLDVNKYKMSAIESIKNENQMKLQKFNSIDKNQIQNKLYTNKHEELIKNKNLVDKLKYQSITNPTSENNKKIDQFYDYHIKKNECDDLERSLKKQIHQEIDNKYKKQMANKVKQWEENNADIKQKHYLEVKKKVEKDKDLRKSIMQGFQQSELDSVDRLIAKMDDVKASKQVTEQKITNRSLNNKFSAKMNQLTKLDKIKKFEIKQQEEEANLKIKNLHCKEERSIENKRYKFMVDQEQKKRHESVRKQRENQNASLDKVKEERRIEALAKVTVNSNLTKLNELDILQNSIINSNYSYGMSKNGNKRDNTPASQMNATRRDVYSKLGQSLQISNRGRSVDPETANRQRFILPENEGNSMNSSIQMNELSTARETNRIDSMNVTMNRFKHNNLQRKE